MRSLVELLALPATTNSSQYQERISNNTAVIEWNDNTRIGTVCNKRSCPRLTLKHLTFFTWQTFPDDRRFALLKQKYHLDVDDTFPMVTILIRKVSWTKWFLHIIAPHGEFYLCIQDLLRNCEAERLIRIIPMIEMRSKGLKKKKISLQNGCAFLRILFNVHFASRNCTHAVSMHLDIVLPL